METTHRTCFVLASSVLVVFCFCVLYNLNGATYNLIGNTFCFSHNCNTSGNFRLFSSESVPSSSVAVSTSLKVKEPIIQFDKDGINISRDFGLYVRMTAKKGKEYFNMLVPSMKYFWFLPVDLTVVLDDTPQDKKFGAEVAAKYPYPKICFEKKFNPKYYHSKGHSFTQLSNFYADNCFNKTYVGFIDSDTFFVTPVVPELLFNGKKPHMNCVYGLSYMPNWKKGTKKALKKKEVFKFMSYFPVIIKMKHIIEMRQYMAKLHKKPFLDVFQDFSQKINDYSQFNIMGNYVWYFHREEYEFHAQYNKPGFVWNETQFRHSMEYYDVNVTDEIKKPFPATSMHFKYQFKQNMSQLKAKEWKTAPQLIKPGICKSGGFKLCHNVCDPTRKTVLHTDLFKFGEMEWTWDTRCLEVQEEHYRNVIMNYSDMIRPQLLEACHYIRKQRPMK